MNVHDHLKELPVEEIKKTYAENTLNAAIGMTHVSGDFNLGNVIRSANFFGFKEVFYIGGKKSYDRRSTVGTHNYIPVNFFRTEEEFVNEIFNKYSVFCIENNVPEYVTKTFSMMDDFHGINWDGYEKGLAHPPLFLFGEEQCGISKYLLDRCSAIFTFPACGTVRSMNVGSCAAIVMAMYRQLINRGVA